MLSFCFCLFVEVVFDHHQIDRVNKHRKSKKTYKDLYCLIYWCVRKLNCGKTASLFIILQQYLCLTVLIAHQHGYFHPEILPLCSLFIC